MATQPKLRAAGRGGAVRPGSTAVLPFTARLRAVGDRLARALPDLTPGTPRLRRELFGVLLVLISLLSAWVLGRGGDNGQLVAWWGRTLDACFGRAAPLLPILIALIALRAFGNQPGPILLPRHYLGGFALGVGAIGLLQLGAGLDHPRAGGYLGVGVATSITRFLGDLGSGLALFVLGIFAIFLLAGTDLQTFAEDVRAFASLLWHGLTTMLRVVSTVIRAIWHVLFFAVMGRRWAATAAPVETAETVATTAAAEPSAEPSRRFRVTPETPVTSPPPVERVINVPQRERPTTSPKQPLAKLPQPAPPGEPLPLPDVGRLALYDDVIPDTVALHTKARLIEETLSSFRVDARVREINPGPAVTQFALEPGTGTKVRRITELQNDLALALAAPSIRIEAPIPGMARVGLEIPNAEIATVGLRETLESTAFSRSKAKLPIPLGRDVNGRYIVGDLTRMPHLLIAGSTGSGKSVCLNGIISTFLLNRTPEDLKLLMIDPKMVELTGYNGVPHLQCPVVTEMDKVVGALRLVLREMERRYTLFSRHGVRNLDGYRLKMADEVGAEQLPYLVVIIDELADLMMTASDEVETLLVRLAQMARATGIHLIIATQRPSVDVLTGLIKANVPARIAFAVSSLVDSRVILDMPGAERLLGRGDMLFMPPDAAKPQRIQGAFIEDRDAQYVVEHWHAVAPIPAYAQEWLDLPSSNPDDEDAGDDPLMEQALEIVRQHGTASASMLQRRLRVGYNRAARLIEQMEEEGIIGPADGIRGRSILVGEE
jgi:S-DNA-T family DNA segregation ATPase FtsK/SpoIIIE